MAKSRKSCIVCKSCVDENLTYHRFPSNKEFCNIWCHALGLQMNNLPKFAYVCSKHFCTKNFIKGSRGTFISKYAVPSIVGFKRPAISKRTSNFTTETASSRALTSEASTISEIETESLVNLQRSSSTESASSRTLTSSETESQSLMSSPKKVFEGQEDQLKSSFSTESASFSSSRTLTASEITSGSSESSPEQNPPNSTQSCPSVGLKRKFDALDVLEVEKESSPVGYTLHSPGISTRKFAKQNLRVPRHFGDIKYTDLEDPIKRTICWGIVKKTISMQKMKIKSLQAKTRRRENKIYSLESLTSELRKNNWISESAEMSLNNSMTESAKQIFSLCMRKRKRKFTPHLRQFALTLNFYSKKAYNYVRRIFSNVLPHTRTLSKWYSNVNASPGFMKEALAAVNMKCMDAALKGNKILCNLVLDEMAIRKKIEWDGKKTYGFVDLGLGSDTENSEAREALVFMLVSLNSSWKIPVAYFLINGLSSSEKANLLNNCLEFVHQSSAVITSITFDGAPSNIAMAKVLGANFSIENLKTYFIHPSTQEKVYIFWDSSHMIKLIRNSFGDQKILEDGDGNIINWEYMEKLCNLQNIEGLHAATKLRKRHMLWMGEKMKVSLAVQTLSKSVAEALDFLNNDLKLTQFQNSTATATFCRNFNNIFDIFNSRSNFTKKPFERPLSQATEKEYYEFMDHCSDYIKNLKIDGRSILSTRKKVGFLGFLICIESLKGLYTYRVKIMKNLKYILTYKLSQDHLEIFFSCIRSKGGYNNNPTSHQFQSIMKKLLIHAEISGSESANAIALDSTAILHCSSASPVIEGVVDDKVLDDFEKDFIESNLWNLTMYCQDIIAYIAGFVVRKIKKIITCDSCLNIIESGDIVSQLQVRKTFGALTKASRFVIELCKLIEKCFRSYKHFFDMKTKSVTYIMNCIKIKTKMNIPPNLIDLFSNHIFDDEPLSNHFNMITDLIFEKYFQLRFHHQISEFNKEKDRVRSRLTKTILFRNQ